MDTRSGKFCIESVTLAVIEDHKGHQELVPAIPFYLPRTERCHRRTARVVPRDPNPTNTPLPKLDLFYLPLTEKGSPVEITIKLIFPNYESSGARSRVPSSGSAKKEDAIELYVRAANSFKMAKQWANAGNAFMKAAQTSLELSNKHEAATQYVDAGNCYRKGDPNEAVQCLHKAIEIYTDMGRFTIAAKHHITIAEIYETELVDIEKAIQNYEQAADYYKGEQSNSSANKCLLKVAQYAAQLENYTKAIEIYEEVGTSAMDNQLLRYSAKDHFFRAAICRMCVEVADAATNVQKYEEMFPAFSDARECKLVKQLITAHDDQNSDAFSEAIRAYDSISRLDQWYTTLLLRVKKSIEGESDLR